MILYHGSNIEIETIDLKKSMLGKDFGRGFYLSDNEQQAYELAVLKTNYLGGTAIINRYEFDERNLIDGCLKIKQFSEYSEEWADFILLNRNNHTETPMHPYDIVYGPIANDKVGVQIRHLLEKNISKEIFIERLKYMKGITFQYFFGTERAIKLLKKL